MVDAAVCFAGAEEFSESINAQGNANVTSQATLDPVVTFLTAGSSLEVEEGGGGLITPSAGDNGASQILPPILLLLSIMIVALL